MTKKIRNGFTLIELLIVIAIIGILSSVVLASLNTTRDKAKNASVKSNLKTIMSQAEVFFDNNGTYVDLCTTDENIASAVSSIATAVSTTTDNISCFSNGSGWIVVAPLKVPDPDGFTYFCTDNMAALVGWNTPRTAETTCQ